MFFGIRLWAERSLVSRLHHVRSIESVFASIRMVHLAFQRTAYYYQQVRAGPVAFLGDIAQSVVTTRK
jgi:hypothetical protein